jgi:hypothetical protein
VADGEERNAKVAHAFSPRNQRWHGNRRHLNRKKGFDAHSCTVPAAQGEPFTTHAKRHGPWKLNSTAAPVQEDSNEKVQLVRLAI